MFLTIRPTHIVRIETNTRSSNNLSHNCRRFKCHNLIDVYKIFFSSLQNCIQIILDFTKSFKISQNKVFTGLKG
jgi:hypothetical protein